IGVGISQQPSNGAVDATLGYKRAEFAFVPTNRNSGEAAGATGGGAKDTGNVILELKYFGIFSTGSDSGVYQRLAVGETAVKQPGGGGLFLKGGDGKLDPETAKAFSAITTVPAVDATVEKAKATLTKKYQEFQSKGDSATIAKFDSAAKASGYADFKAFAVD